MHVHPLLKKILDPPLQTTHLNALKISPNTLTDCSYDLTVGASDV